MSRFIELHRVAQRDLEECAESIRRKRPRSALRFLQASQTIPEMGSLYESDHPDLSGVRFFPVTRFRNYWYSTAPPLPASRFCVCSTVPGTSKTSWVERSLND